MVMLAGANERDLFTPLRYTAMPQMVLLAQSMGGLHALAPWLEPCRAHYPKLLEPKLLGGRGSPLRGVDAIVCMA